MGAGGVAYERGYMKVQILRWQFTVADFARMIEAGIFAEDDRVELIDGEVRAMSPIEPRHAAIVKRLNALMSRQVGDRAILSVQEPIQLTDYTEPQPDLAVLRLREDFYVQAHPVPADVLVVVEVAETSLEYDREEKVPRYAQVCIPEVWLLDVEAGNAHAIHATGWDMLSSGAHLTTRPRPRVCHGKRSPARAG
jgi:Uma2 family endonuclease